MSRRTARSPRPPRPAPRPWCGRTARSCCRTGRIAVVRPFVHAALGLHEAREDAVQLFGVLEVVADDRRGVRVVDDERLEERVAVPALAVDDVVDEAAQESDVRPGADRRVDIGHGAGAREPRIDVDDLGAVLDLGLHGPAEGHRMVLRHVGAHDDDAVGVRHAPRIHRRRAATESCPQTGDAGAVSYPGLVLDGDDAEAAHELLVEVVPLDVEGGAAEGEDGRVSC